MKWSMLVPLLMSCVCAGGYRHMDYYRLMSAVTAKVGMRLKDFSVCVFVYMGRYTYSQPCTHMSQAHQLSLFAGK